MSDSVYPASSLTGVSPDVERIQEYDTITQRESGGRELSISSRTQARYTWRLNYGYLSETNAATLSAFYHSMRGRAESFLFADPLSTSASLWGFRDGIGTGTVRTGGNGSWTTVYASDWNSDPVAGKATSPAMSVWVDDVELVYGSGAGKWTSNTTNGALQVVFGTAPGNGLTVYWNGGYHRRVKFTEDGLQLRRVVPGAYTATVQVTSQVLP